MIGEGTFTYGTYELSSQGEFSLSDMENLFSQAMLEQNSKNG